MKGENTQKKKKVQELGPDEEATSTILWSRSQWRQFIVVFTVAVIVTSGLFWIFLIRQEIGLQRHYELLSRQFDQEWAYLQKLSRLHQIQRISEQEGSDEAVFNGESLGLSFSYPKTWGEFKELNALTYYTSVGLKRGTLEKIIGAYNDIPPADYISGWDAAAVGIWTPEDIDRVCERNTLANTCLTLTTKSGIRYARIRYTHFLELDGYINDVVIYIFVNPEGDFPAIAFSNIGLRKSGIPHRISEMDATMESIVFQKF